MIIFEYRGTCPFILTKVDGVDHVILILNQCIVDLGCVYFVSVDLPTRLCKIRSSNFPRCCLVLKRPVDCLFVGLLMNFWRVLVKKMEEKTKTVSVAP